VENPFETPGEIDHPERWVQTNTATPDEVAAPKRFFLPAFLVRDALMSFNVRKVNRDASKSAG
jgi:hypothetical protein